MVDRLPLQDYETRLSTIYSMPHMTRPIDTNRILTTNADLDRRWKTLKADIDAQHVRTARMILETRHIVDDTKRMLEASMRHMNHISERIPTPK